MITVILLLSTVAYFILATPIFLQKRNLENILFVAICMCFAVWSVSILAFLQFDNEAVVKVAAQTFYTAAGLFPALLLIFANIFPQGTKSASKTILSLAGLSSLIIVGLIIFYPSFIIDRVVLAVSGNYVVVDQWTYLLYGVYFVTMFIFAISVALSKALRYSGTLRKKAGLYAVGILITSIPGLITNLILPYFGNYTFIWIGPTASVVFLALTAYSIARHGLFNIRQAAMRSTAYIFTLVTLAAIYYFLAYLVSAGISQMDGQSIIAFGPFNILLALLLAIVFQPIKRFFDRVTNGIFYENTYSVDEFFAQINKELSQTNNLKDLLGGASVKIAEALRAVDVSFVVYKGSEKIVQFGSGKFNKISYKDVKWLEDYLVKVSSEPIVLSLLDKEDEMLRRMMVSHRLAIILPLMRQGQSIGYLLLGEHKRSSYTLRDIRVISTLADEFVIAIQNALAVEQIRDLNAHLEQRIDAATKELRRSNAQLQKLDESKDDFISMASHQLRTPLTSIKGYISMLVEGDLGKISNEQKQVLNEAFISSERMVRLISDFLNVSRLQTGKFVIDKHPVDLALLVQRELDSLVPNATARGISFSYKYPKNISKLDLDENKIQQVVMNFCDNAIYYSKENSKVIVSLKKTLGWVELTVKDTGIGVPEEDQSRLFKKFFRAPNAKRARPDGTGVGLFLAKTVIDDHGGQIIFESKEGKGSTFGFRLPLPKK